MATSIQPTNGTINPRHIPNITRSSLFSQRPILQLPKQAIHSVPSQPNFYSRSIDNLYPTDEFR